MLACCLSYPFHVCSSTPPLPCSSCAGHHTLLEVFPAAFPALVTLFNDLACFVLLHVLRHRADGGRLVEDIGRQRFDLQRFSEASDQVDTHQRVATQFEEIIINADLDD